MVYRTGVSEVVRRIAFFACAAFIVLAPGYRQFVEAAPPYTIRWEMFSGIATDLFEVSYATLAADGTRVPLDRFSTLGFPEPSQAPRNVRTIKQEAEAWNIARALCRTLGPGKPVFMQLRDATRRGWKLVEDGSQDVCQRSAQPVRAKPARGVEEEVTP
jgi:hypothetical protein